VGKPVVKGTRISVELIVDLLAAGWTQEQILDSYPNLTLEDIRASLGERAGFEKLPASGVAQGHAAFAGTCGLSLRSCQTGSVGDGHRPFNRTGSIHVPSCTGPLPIDGVSNQAFDRGILMNVLEALIEFRAPTEDVIVEPALPNWLRIFVSRADPSKGSDLDAHQDV
jgi:hypothetical protein